MMITSVGCRFSIVGEETDDRTAALLRLPTPEACSFNTGRTQVRNCATSTECNTPWQFLYLRTMSRLYLAFGTNSYRTHTARVVLNGANTLAREIAALFDRPRMAVNSPLTYEDNAIHLIGR
ncbi:unnamed protein product [Strongylus vulgaris]|uniref:Uncharacterized protein n=1 Tax=Strongylus vulgaris TaxID=40348 RepID=A0A3P7JFA6_STRVU|nr:unnamed protein product [Strongylus vulgaris]